MSDQIRQSTTVKTSHTSRSISPDDVPASEMVAAARGFLAAFAKAAKSYSLYPATHIISENLLSGLENSLTNLFQTSSDLKFDIEKDRICYREIEVYRPNGIDDVLITPFFRDGIIWIEFRKGVTAVELSFLLDTLNEYRTITDESEGDLVTALWKKNLPHINYEAADVFWETEPSLDFSHFRVSETSDGKLPGPSSLGNGSGAGKKHSDSGNAASQSTVSIVSAEIDGHLMPLTSAENQKLQELIREEAHRNHNEDVLDVLLIILEDEDDEAEFGSILELLVQEFENTLGHGEFQQAIKIIDHLKKLPDQDAEKKIWRRPLVDQFFESISDSEVLGAFKSYLAEFKSEDAKQIKKIRQVLLMLRPKAILSLGPLLAEVSSLGLRRRLMEAIGILSKQDLKPLRQLLKASDEQMVRRLVTIVGHLDGKDPQRLLLHMTRHFSLDVRREALKQLLRRNGGVQRSFFFMLDDPSDIIRHEILHRLTAERNQTSEDLLLTYIEQKEFTNSTDDHVLACYTALGKCGSARSIPFLKATLEERAWWQVFSIGGSLHPRGAALALAELQLPEAEDILMRANRGFFPHIRRLARRALSRSRPQ